MKKQKPELPKFRFPRGCRVVHIPCIVFDAELSKIALRELERVRDSYSSFPKGTRIMFTYTYGSGIPGQSDIELYKI